MLRTGKMNKIKLAPTATMAMWIRAIRPKTLTAAIVPFFSGAALAYTTGASIAWGVLISTILSAIFIQIATNLINDAFDFSKGADDEERLGPHRAIQQGMATSQQVFSLGIIFFLLAFLIGTPILIQGGFPIAMVMLLSMVSGYLYTGGPFPLAYIGLGDFFVVIFFGWVATLSGYWLQTGYIDGKSFLLGTQIGLLCTLMIAINNLRDISSDIRANKKTLAVRFGQNFAKMEIFILASVPFILNFFWFYWGYIYAALLPYFSFPLATLLITKIWKNQPSKMYNQYLGLAALLHLLFGLLLIIGFILNVN